MEQTKQSLAVITAVCANYKGNLEEHKQIQTALQVISNALTALDTPKEAPKPSETCDKPA